MDHSNEQTRDFSVLTNRFQVLCALNGVDPVERARQLIEAYVDRESPRVETIFCAGGVNDQPGDTTGNAC